MPEAAGGFAICFIAERNKSLSLVVCAGVFKELRNMIQQEESPVPSLDINY